MTPAAIYEAVDHVRTVLDRLTEDMDRHWINKAPPTTAKLTDWIRRIDQLDLAGLLAEMEEAMDRAGPSAEDLRLAAIKPSPQP